MGKKVPKFKLGQVVSVRYFYGDFSPGETGPGFRGRPGWRHGFEFGKIVKILPKSPAEKKSAPICYFLDGWMSAQPEDNLRRLTQKETQ